MNHRLWVAAALIATILAGCADLENEPLDEAPDFHSAQTLPGGQYHCAGCHYGVAPVWLADWEPAGPNQWDLRVRSAWPHVDLLTVDVVAGNETPIAYSSGFLYEEMDGSWSHAFDVPPGASTLFARFYTAPGATSVGPAYLTSGNELDPPTIVWLVAPDGSRIDVEGPEVELKQITLLDPAPGSWALHAEVAGDYLARGYVHVGNGEGAGPLGPQDSARFRFNGTVPPSVQLAVRPYHDHDPFEYYSADWDYADSFLYTGIELATFLGSAPAPFDWSPSAIDPFWGEAEEVAIQSDRIIDLSRTYVEDTSRPDEDTLTYYGSQPFYYVQAEPIPAGTEKVRIEVSWNPPVEQPNLQIRLGPRETPYYFDAEAVERGLGTAVFEAEWKPEWWDITFVDGVPRLAERGSLDIAPYVSAEDGEVVARVMQGTLDAYAVRGS